MFNGYNDTPLISYEYSQERLEKKHEKWSYGHDAGVQPAQAQPNNRHADFWPGKSNYLGIPKCNCTGCYPPSEKQSYQGDTTRHRPWLPRSFPVPVNGSTEPCKLPACQWDAALPNQSYGEGGLPYMQENGGKYPYYKHHQRMPEPNQPGVITSLKSSDYPKKPKSGQESPVQNGTRHPVFCNPAYGLTKRLDGRNYCEPMEKYSNLATYPVEQHIPRLPVVEPFTKAVPSNLSQSRVPSTGYRSVKENMPQPHDLGYVEGRKICTEPEINCDQRNDAFPIQDDYSHFYRDLPEMEPQKLFFDNARHPDYYTRTNFQDAIKRNTQTLDNRKDCAVNQVNDISVNEQHYNISRRHQDAGNAKTCDIFCPKDFEKTRPENLPGNPTCFQETKNENRLPSSVIFNDPRFADRTQNSFPYQSNPVVYRNYLRPEYPCQGYNAQPRYEYPRNEYRGAQQQIQSCEQIDPQQNFAYDPRYQPNLEKTQPFYKGKNPPAVVQVDPQTPENRNPTYLEAIRSEELNKNGTSKISPLRLLRKKKFINVPQESAPVSTLDTVPGLDVRKFWSTWAEEEEENVAPTQMVVLDCQNIDPEQAKLLHLYEPDPVRSIHLETANTVIKNVETVKESPEKAVKTEETSQSKIEENPKTEIPPQEETEKNNSASQPESKSEAVESVSRKTNKHSKKTKSGQENRKKSEIRDKWTEKKFDFLKRAEESKAAEILRHEEEKKKIFETRLSLQQSLKKSQGKGLRGDDETVPETDENSLTDSPAGCDATPLPTCEYRRNKFLDYKVIPNGEETTAETEIGDEIKKEESIKQEEKQDEWPKYKEENALEDILKKMSEINFQSPDVKFADLKKPKTKKTKKKKSDQTETDDRTDKLTVETVNKQPTIKFSIQKSHDLKISFKVLNSSSKEYSDEDAAGEETQEKGKVGEDSKNSTELITLEYKSIKRDGELKKNRRRKKQNPKAPVLKIKKSRYMRQEKDPLADDGTVSKTFYHPDAAAEGFQVKETMDSAKIKLTFKRHKGNFETEYKINSNNVEKVSEVDPVTPSGRKKSKKSKKQEIFAEPGVRNPESNLESDSNRGNAILESLLEEDSRNSSTSRDSYMKEENCSLQSSPITFSEFSQFAIPTPENDEIKRDPIEVETDKLGDCAETKFPLLADVSLKELTTGEEKTNFEEEISLDFIPKSPEIDSNHNSEKTADLESLQNNSLAKQSENPLGISESPHRPSEKDRMDTVLRQSPSKITDDAFGKSFDSQGTTILDLEYDGYVKDSAEETSEVLTYTENTCVVEKESRVKEVPDSGSFPQEERDGSPSPDVAREEMSLTAKPSENQNDSKLQTDETEQEDQTTLDLCLENIPGRNQTEAEQSNHINSQEEYNGYENSVSFLLLNTDKSQTTTAEKDESGQSEPNQSSPNNQLDQMEADRQSEADVPNQSSEDSLNDQMEAYREKEPEIPERSPENFPNLSDQIETYNQSEPEIPGRSFPNSLNDQIEETEPEIPEPNSENCLNTLLEIPDQSSEKSPSYQMEAEEHSEPEIHDGNYENSLNDQIEADRQTELEIPDQSSEKSSSYQMEAEGHGEPEIPHQNSLNDQIEADRETEPEIPEPNSENFLNDQMEMDRHSEPGVLDRFSKYSPNNLSDQIEDHGKTEPEILEKGSGMEAEGHCEPEVPDGSYENSLTDQLEADTEIEPEIPDRSSENSLDNLSDQIEAYRKNEPEILERNSENSSNDQTEADRFEIPDQSSEKAPNMSDQIDAEVHSEPEVPDRSSENSPNNQTEANSHGKPKTTENCLNDQMEADRLIKPATVETERKENAPEQEIEDNVVTLPKVHDPTPNKDKKLETDLPLLDNELEDGELIDEPEDKPEKEEKPKMKDFTARKIERRHSTFPQPDRFQTWSRRKFSKAKSCPPEIRFLYIPVENIPLPVGPPPFESCFDFKKYLQKPEKEEPTTDLGNLQKAAQEPVGIFERSTKIKFSFLKRSKFSKSGLKEVKLEESGTKMEKENFDVGKPKIPTPERICEEETKAEQPVMSCEDITETVEVMDTMTDFIHEEFYECEDIPTSEDFTNGEDLEIEKVNDDKFRNIMQNCLDNAKKFLNVGNLKLFSCSVDDLLELDCSDSSFDPEKPTNHISRDVLLTSCEDANDDLGLSENIQPADISMDFVPSFCTDVCPEILPVDNWPYLEEEVLSSPKPDDSDLIPSLENAFTGATPETNGTDRRRRKRVTSETSYKRFRRKSLIPEGEALRMCSKIGVQRRKTIDVGESLQGMDIRDLKKDLMRLKNEADDKSLKCRLSLEKITSGINFGIERQNGGKATRNLDYRSPSWQPKVMLFRISKNELKKVLKSRFPPKSSGDSVKRKMSGDLGSKVADVIKRHKSDPDLEKLYIKPVQEFGEAAETQEKDSLKEYLKKGSSKDYPKKDSPKDYPKKDSPKDYPKKDSPKDYPKKDSPKDYPKKDSVKDSPDLIRLDSIKGSLTTADVRKRKKSRFRNLHTKRKPEPDASKKDKSSDPETIFEDTFKDSSNDIKTKNDETSKRKPDTSESSKEEKHSQRRSSDEWKRDKHRKKYDHRDRRREKSEGKEQSEHKDRRRESESRRHGHDSGKHHRRSPGGSRHPKKDSDRSSSDKKSKSEASWVCEVCGFNDAEERVVHIKNHPFHCQSCHLAFKTEAHFISHLTKKHKDIRNQHHCLLCELSFDTEDQYHSHLDTREHKHLESVEKNTINTLFTWLTGSPCPVFGLLEMRPEWLPNQAGTVHFYHQATPLSLALQYLKMNHDISSFSTSSSTHPN